VSATPTGHLSAAREARTAIKFAAVGLIGLAIDAALLRAGIVLGLSPAIARIISLFFAMQATFAVNGLIVFRCLTRERLPAQWASYMATNGLGNFCNYWIFVTLVSLHPSVISNYYVAICVGAFFAWMINFAGARLVAFGPARRSVRKIIAPNPQAAFCGPLTPASGPTAAVQPPPLT